MSFANIKLIIIGVLVLVIFSAGGVVGWKLQSSKVEKAKAEKQLALQQLAECQAVNKAYAADMASMKEENEALNASCKKRLQTKDSLIVKIREIDGLKPTTDKGVKNAKDASGDPLLGALNRVFPDKADRKN